MQRKNIRMYEESSLECGAVKEKPESRGQKPMTPVKAYIMDCRRNSSSVEREQSGEGISGFRVRCSLGFLAIVV